MFIFKTPVIVSMDGTINWFSPTKMKSSCKVNITYFPFDAQICRLTFGSWTYTGAKLNITFLNGLEGADMKSYTKNGQWELLSADAKKNRILYPCCPEPYLDLTFEIRIKRRSLFYTNNLIIPCLLLSILAACSFLFPPETGERVALVITVLLGMTVFMLMFTEAIPPNSETQSLIGRFSAAMIVEVSLSLLFTCGILRLYHHYPNTKIPNWIRKIIFNTTFSCKRSFVGKKKNKFTFARGSKMEAKQTDVLANGGVATNRSKNHSINDNNEQICLVNDCENLCKLKAACKLVDADHNLEQRKSEWRALVKLLDKLSFLLFIFTFLLSFFLLLPVGSFFE